MIYNLYKGYQQETPAGKELGRSWLGSIGITFCIADHLIRHRHEKGREKYK